VDSSQVAPTQEIFFLKLHHLFPQAQPLFYIPSHNFNDSPVR